MGEILNGEPYIPSLSYSSSCLSSSSTGSPKGKAESMQTSSDPGYQSRHCSAYRPSTGSSVPMGDLNRLDSLVRQKLESLLDETKPHKDWVSLADRLGLGNMINQLKQFDSPTSILLDQYEVSPTLPSNPRQLKSIKLCSLLLPVHNGLGTANHCLPYVT